jgi:hypothetical protein
MTLMQERETRRAALRFTFCVFDEVIVDVE